MSDSDNWVDNNSELAVDEDSELDIVNNETFADIVDLDYAWEEQHQLAASQLEREKVQQRLVQSSTPEVDKEFRMLSLQARGSQGLGTDIRNEVDSFTVSGGKEPLFSSERWDKNLFENDREVAVEQQLRQTPWKTEWLSRRPKKVLFAQDLERSLLENTSQGRTLPGKNNTTKSSLEPVTKTERMEFLDEVFAREFPRLESELVSAQDDRKKTVSSMPSNRFRRSQDTSSGQRPKRTGYYRKGDNRQFIRRLYSKWMTCSEIELIAKMHIRQLETASWPVEDFYCQAFQQKKQKKSEERLKKYSKPLDPKKRILKNRYFPHHSENNLKLLKRALGSIQGYNPNAPRRIVQVANEPVSDNVLEKEESFRGDTLLHEDSRVTAQSAIALAFDILFDWEDGLFSCTSAVELEEFKARMSRRLLSAFGISVEEGLRDEARNIFSRVCTLPKGRKLILRSFAVLPVTYVVLLLRTFLRSLGMILKRMSKTQLEDSSWQQLLDHVLHLIEDMEDASVITEWIHAFDIGHRDERYFSFVTTSSCGLTLIMTLLFSAFRIDYSTRPSLKSVVNNLCERLILSVEEMFDHVEHAIVWQLIALLDGFVEATLREKLRMIIKKLIEEQRITLST